jgi:hypothetical protein
MDSFSIHMNSSWVYSLEKDFRNVMNREMGRGVGKKLRREGEGS